MVDFESGRDFFNRQLVESPLTAATPIGRYTPSTTELEANRRQQT